jgi:hypothetical protein
VLGSTPVTLDNIRPYVENVLNNSNWTVFGVARGPKGLVIGEVLEARHVIGGQTVWVRAFKKLDGTIIVNNAGVR